MQLPGKPNGKAPVDELIPDSRVEPIWDRLNKELNLPDDTQFATMAQAAHWSDNPDGLAILEPEKAVFWVVAPNPQPRHKGQTIKQYASIRMEDWRMMEAERWRFAGAPDPAYLIFKQACLKMLRVYKDYKEMN